MAVHPRNRCSIWGCFRAWTRSGKLFKTGAMFIPEVLLSAKTMAAAMEVLKPLLAKSEGGGRGTVVIGTVQGDLHNIGKNLVAMMLEGAGFTVVDLGIDVKPQAFLDAVKQHKPKLLGMSALLTTTMPRMGETIRALEEAGIRSQVKVMVGGAPVTEGFRREDRRGRLRRKCGNGRRCGQGPGGRLSSG